MIQPAPRLDDLDVGFPAVGIWSGVPMADYLAFDACSASRLNDIRRSPAYCRLRATGHDDDQTDATRFGQMVHALALEAGTFAERYVVSDRCCATLAKGGLCKNHGRYRRGGFWRCGTHDDEMAGELDGRAAVSPDDVERGHAIASALLAHPRVGPLFASSPQDSREISLVWKDERTGLTMKGRPDLVGTLRKKRVLLDVKVMRDSSDTDRALWTVLRMGIHRQSYLYSAGLAALGAPVDLCAIAAVEPRPPHEVTYYVMDSAMLMQGAKDCDGLAEAYADCAARNVWAPWSEEEVRLELPDRMVFALQEDEEDDNG